MKPQINKVSIPESITKKLEGLYQKSLTPLLDICKFAGLDSSETNLVKRHFKSYLMFEKRGRVTDLEKINSIISKRSFRVEMESVSEDLRFFSWMLWDFVTVASFYRELSAGSPWDAGAERVMSQLDGYNTVISYSGVSMIISYILSKKPTPEEISQYDEEATIETPEGETLNFTDNKIIEFYAIVKIIEENALIRALGNDFYDFVKIVLYFFPEEKDNLFKISGLPVPDEIRDKIISDAIERFEKISTKAEDSEKVEEEPIRKDFLVPMSFDAINALKRPNPHIVDDKFVENKAALYLLNKDNYTPITEQSITIASELLTILAGTNGGGLTPVSRHKYKASIYKLYQIAKGGDYKPSNDDINEFIMGLDYLRFPSKVSCYFNHKTKGKIPAEVSLQFCMIDALVLPTAENHSGLGSQEITLTIGDILVGKKIDPKFIIEAKGVKSREELESIDPKDKEKRFVPAEALKKTSPEWQRFRNCILSSLHKKEADLMETVFDYSGQIAKAQEKDKEGVKYEGKGDFKTNEAYIRRHIQKHKDRDKTRLNEFFERAKALKIISSYKKTKSGVYSWQWGNKSEDENED